MPRLLCASLRAAICRMGPFGSNRPRTSTSHIAILGRVGHADLPQSTQTTPWMRQKAECALGVIPKQHNSHSFSGSSLSFPHADTHHTARLFDLTPVRSRQLYQLALVGRSVVACVCVQVGQWFIWTCSIVVSGVGSTPALPFPVGQCGR
jgi:hypothetical protein